MDPEGADADRWAGAALTALDGMGPVKMRALRECFGSWKRAWERGPDGWRIAGIGDGLRDRWRQVYFKELPERIRTACMRAQITVLTESDISYPAPIRDLGESAPLLLFLKGRLDLLNRLAVTVVGTRRPSPYGKQIAERVAAMLAEAGVLVISGMAFGIDAVVHKTVLAEKGDTAAVLGSGPERASPRSQRDLYHTLVQRGLIVSEYPPGTPAGPGRFPARNRILAAWGEHTVVIEAPERSGALGTAQHAVEVGRRVLAVPGPITSPTSRGCLELLRDGAEPLLDPEDALPTRIDPTRNVERDRGGSRETRSSVSLTADEKLVYALLDVAEARSTDRIISLSGLSPARVAAALGGLEIKGLCERVGASVFGRICHANVSHSQSVDPSGRDQWRDSDGKNPGDRGIAGEGEDDRQVFGKKLSSRRIHGTYS